MNPAESWVYTGGDDCADFFGSCLRQAAIDVPTDARVLEIGCAEFNWLAPAAKSWPSMRFTGIDWRVRDPHLDTEQIVRLKCDARDSTLFPADTFDWIVSISAIEHIGLGHYERDPEDADGDIHVIQNAMRWLKPGGWLLFDVPYDPGSYRVHGTEYRAYDDAALRSRLRVEDVAIERGPWYASPGHSTVLIDKPRISGSKHFYYVGMAWQKRLTT